MYMFCAYCFISSNNASFLLGNMTHNQHVLYHRISGLEFLLYSKRSILNSTLNEPVHAYSCEIVEYFDVDILQRAEMAVDVALLKARLISRKCPLLNHCYEWNAV